MPAENYYKNVHHIIHISTDGYIDCTGFTDAINQYIKEQGYKLLHIGTITTTDTNTSGLRHNTVAILGK